LLAGLWLEEGEGVRYMSLGDLKMQMHENAWIFMHGYAKSFFLVWDACICV
jgi:hypothetical protein